MDKTNPYDERTVAHTAYNTLLKLEAAYKEIDELKTINSLQKQLIKVQSEKIEILEDYISKKGG